MTVVKDGIIIWGVIFETGIYLNKNNLSKIYLEWSWPVWCSFTNTDVQCLEGTAVHESPEPVVTMGISKLPPRQEIAPKVTTVTLLFGKFCVQH